MSNARSSGFTIGLCYPTVMRANLATLVDAASAGRFDTVTVSPALFRHAQQSGHSDADLRLALDDRGLSVASIDTLIQPLPGRPPEDRMTPVLRDMLTY